MTPVHILLVEDNEGDIVLTLEAFKDGKLKNSIQVVRDGEEALQYLHQQGPYLNATLPDIILLDINLPRMDGKEVLLYIKSHDQFKLIPVVVLTTSSSEKDISDVYASFANCYITKPVDFEKFTKVIRSIEEFWISIVQLPVKK
ncbi:MAG: response regulator [Chitinophagaceae bacterium]|nr:response regulator [Chitinophagaceae bacterium]